MNYLIVYIRCYLFVENQAGNSTIFLTKSTKINNLQNTEIIFPLCF